MKRKPKRTVVSRYNMQQNGFSVQKRSIGGEHPVFIIAEMSANHLGDYLRAKRLIAHAADAGADAIKLQTYTADDMTIDSTCEDFIIHSGSPWDGRSFFELYESAATPWEWHSPLKEYAESLGLVFFSSPFSLKAVDFLDDIGVELFKLASFEITDIPLIEYLAKKGKPVILSSGVADKEDIQRALDIFHRAGCRDLGLLKCISSYPAPAQEYNLRTLSFMEDAFGVVPGVSDHSLGNAVSVVSCGAGAKIVEKHLCEDRSLGGPDASFSLEPHEFSQMVRRIRETEEILGSSTYELTQRQKKGRDFSRSLYVVEDMARGDCFTPETVRSIRPGFGLHPRYYREILGKRAACDIGRGTPLSADCIAGSFLK
jgi:pseudaminic acid synthase